MDYLVYQISELPPADCFAGVLSDDELELALSRGGDYARIRGVLRQELARRCHCAAHEIVFSYGSRGKPACACQHFNISHSGDCLCLAFHHADIGVDIEQIKPRNFDSLAERFMAPEQLAQFRQRGCRSEEFYACWCAAEALVKRAGDTMWHAHAYPFIYQCGRIHCLFEQAPTITLFTPMPGYQGAVACS